ncbi:hypothetical protein [Nocardioides sp. SYSU D00038]|uniref:hypothetical protein n=1 Tax=Nocardioides sp. SYSU D00038 TaxID=2812554 RepID=UPI0019681965|nr:hypothetical protein [Nocardioides sp. SYSU D00038]
MDAAEIGIAAVGAVAAYIAMYFVARMPKHGVANLTGVFGALFSGVVVSFIVTNIKSTKTDPQDVWWYGVGLAVGLVVWIALRALKGGEIAWWRPSP